MHLPDHVNVAHWTLPLLKDYFRYPTVALEVIRNHLTHWSKHNTVIVVSVVGVNELGFSIGDLPTISVELVTWNVAIGQSLLNVNSDREKGLLVGAVVDSATLLRKLMQTDVIDRDYFQSWVGADLPVSEDMLKLQFKDAYPQDRIVNALCVVRDEILKRWQQPSKLQLVTGCKVDYVNGTTALDALSFVVRESEPLEIGVCFKPGFGTYVVRYHPVGTAVRADQFFDEPLLVNWSVRNLERNGIKVDTVNGAIEIILKIAENHYRDRLL